MTTITRVETKSNSIYELKEDANGRFWFRGNNVPTSTSVKLTQTWYEVRQPEPPRIGERWVVESIYPIAMAGHPDRINGGGKITSPILSIEVVNDNE